MDTPIPSLPFDIVRRYHSLTLQTPPAKAHQMPAYLHRMSTEFISGPMSWDSVLLVTQEQERWCSTVALSQLRSSHCCICTAYNKMCPPLVHVIPITVIPVSKTHIINYNNLKAHPLQSRPVAILCQIKGFKSVINSSPCF